MVSIINFPIYGPAFRMHGSSHTAKAVAGFVDILHRTNGFPASGLSGKPSDAMLQPLWLTCTVMTCILFLTDCDLGQCCCAVLFFFSTLTWNYSGCWLLKLISVVIYIYLHTYCSCSVLLSSFCSNTNKYSQRRETVDHCHIKKHKCCLDKRIFITVTQLKDQRCKCWERKKGNLTWTMRLMRRASKETHTDGEW